MKEKYEDLIKKNSISGISEKDLEIKLFMRKVKGKFTLQNSKRCSASFRI